MGLNIHITHCIPEGKVKLLVKQANDNAYNVHLLISYEAAIGILKNRHPKRLERNINKIH